ncbi:hypothetical protein NPX99_08120 [Bartonella sp. 220]|uniref:hypothetical protein n=1 Tax=Bartonella sp. 220B TaxID=2967260 RepID=UPI0022A8F12F|nr:hypothetical protein [Bartonella sp. 220B]MCZ2159206.1 hypothetical protein [Bartonella sp. 220B]
MCPQANNISKAELQPPLYKTVVSHLIQPHTSQYDFDEYELTTVPATWNFKTANEPI